MGVSKSMLYRKTKKITGLGPNDFFNELRLNRALELILRKNRNVSQISDELGFATPSYFTKCFKKRYKFLPTDLLKIYT